MPRLTIAKIWYQNDFGRTGLRDERLTRALAADPQVARIVHVEPPVASEQLAERAQGVREGALTLFTPTFSKSDANPWAVVIEQTARFLAAEGVVGPDSLLWVNAPSALGDNLLASLGGRFGRIVSEVEDDHREYLAARSEERLAAQRRYERIVRAGDLLVSNNAKMIREWSRLQPVALHVPNAVEPGPYATRPAMPAGLARLAKLARPLITYAGNLRLRLEPKLIGAVARAFPKATIVLAGIGGEALLPQLKGLKNVKWLGLLPPAEVPALLMHSDVLILPHAIGPLTDSMDPQKIYEYLASGRPIVATPVAGAREQAEFIALAPSQAEFVAAVGAALRDVDPAASLRRHERGIARSWADAAREILDGALAVERPLERWRAEQRFGYFQHDRPEVRRLVPPDAGRVLDVGCGAGALGSALKFQRDVKVTGIELDPAAAARAALDLDAVHVGDAVEQLKTLPDRQFDAVLFADLLEHLPAPEEALAQARRLLAPGGVVIASLPNVRHWSVLKQLLEGDFRYEPAGILDRTHLRFFTRRSALRLFEAAGFTVGKCEGTRWAEEGMPAAVAQALAGLGLEVDGLLEESRDHQLLLVAAPTVGAETAAGVPVAVPRVSVVIPVCNAAGYTRGCLEELEKRGGDGLEVIVVDNGSSDETSAVLADHPRVRVIRNEENRGFAGAVNQGLFAARGTFVCVLNNDTLLTEGWLAPMLGLLEREPSIGLVGPCTSYAKGPQQIDLTMTGEPFEDIAQMHELARAWCAREQGRCEDVAFLSGFCFVGRRADLVALGGLSEAYGRGTFEDDELCRKLRRAGRRLVIARDCYVHHFGNRTFQALAIDVAAQQKENFLRFAQRHQGDQALHARVALEAQRPHDALKLALAGLKQEPADLDAFWAAVEATARLDRPAQAAVLARRYLERCPMDAAARALLQSCESASAGPQEGRKTVPGSAPEPVPEVVSSH